TVLSVLDQSPIRRGGTPQTAVQETLVLAQYAEKLGYHRYWLAEHHSSRSLASASPELLIGEIANRTERIRVGSGGVMLSHYSALKVAESFRMLETLHPGRIDLGIGRAPGSDGRTAAALAHGPGALGIEHFPEQIAELTGFIRNEMPETHPFHTVRAMPEGSDVPELWLLGSSTEGGAYAAHFGWAFSFAHFISPEGGDAVVRDYFARFQPSQVLHEPRANIGVSVTCADTQEEAELLGWSRWCSRVLSFRNEQMGIVPPEEARDFLYTPREREYIDYQRSKAIYGTPEQVRDKLDELGRRYGVDEFVVLTVVYDFAARLHSYELLAKAFGLAAAQTQPLSGVAGSNPPKP
ncbi:MAG TPA: LLM class flavin-dependent oxidoreductase, partial [Bryobacteraceae bacterium]|nr:LLM class flavin-dependent oxidoreductase [Bryobacteraceae bacterium]